MAIDPVCGMEVDEKAAPARTTYGGKQYYFCAPLCRERFEEDPLAYARSMDSGVSLRNLFRLR